LKNTVQVFQHLIVPEPNNGNPQLSKKGSSSFVPCHLFGFEVRIAVNFNRQSKFRAEQINHIDVYTMLPPKFQSSKFPTFKLRPQQNLGQ